MRWAVLITLLTSIRFAYTGYSKRRTFGKTDNTWRHWTATVSHMQLIIGMLVYTQSSTAKFNFRQISFLGHIKPEFFFGVVHLLMMLIAIVLVTIGSAVAKRKPNDHEKFKTMLIWFSLALFIILLAIPWPFSPLAQRSYLHTL
ncbi:hypothetical protein [Mucilaginibacter sp. MD40]|uniref:hypothetical protein n=1 Tax=Mucilaginibacter sp. MD40 TaxID=2029590 RepID=UPI001E523796|nr:hypothetical protein [Mucilaginibacter sp. MD40]